MLQRRTQLILGNVVLAIAVIARPGSAQVNRPTAAPAEPCCGIVAINKTTGIVTARTNTGKTFQFKVGHAGPVDGFAAKTGLGPVDGFQPVDGFSSKNPVGPVDGYIPVDGAGPVDAARFLGTLRVGQKIWANLAGQVSINNMDPCCGIIMSGITH